MENLDLKKLRIFLNLYKRYKLFGNIEHCAIINKYSNSELVKEKIINNYY